MKKLKFETDINAPADKVWNALWNDQNYTDWTSGFSEGSTMKSDWQIGGRTLFVDPENNGMIATITDLEPNKKVHFKHIGHIMKGVEDTESDEVKDFAGAMETYDLQENDGVTHLVMSVDVTEKWEEMMTDGFTKGMQRIKELAEK